MLKKNIEKNQSIDLLKNLSTDHLMTQSIEKNFVIDPLTTNYAIYRDSLILVLHICSNLTMKAPGLTQFF